MSYRKDCVGILLRGTGMQSDPSCPVCTAPGWLAGGDEKGRWLSACPTAGCDVVEYDNGIIHHRKSAVVASPTHMQRQRRIVLSPGPGSARGRRSPRYAEETGAESIWSPAADSGEF